MLLLLGSLTLGLWIIWELIHMGTDLLAQSILDGVAAVRSRTLCNHIATEPWYRRVIGLTLLHFVTLAASIVIFLSACSFLKIGIDEAERKQRERAAHATY